MGFAYDGDGDRCIAVDEKGNVIDGDKIIGLLAMHYSSMSKDVVATVMSNVGLELFLKERGLNLHRTPVGDRFVAEKMEEVGALIGGEQSGHIIVREFGKTGDGILTSVLIASIVKSLRKPMSEVFDLFKLYPQKLVNVRVKKKIPLENLESLQKVLKEVEEELKDRGRIVLRYSGTEPVLRVMVEADSEELIEKIINRIVEAIKSEGITE
jgi:phosphoglucosamine mutase